VCAVAVALCGGVYAAEPEKPVVQEEKETSLSDFVSFEAGIKFDSKYVSYGLIDNKDPIITPSASVSFFDFLYFGVSAIFDITKNGKKAGYSNRGGRYTDLYPEAGVYYSFTPDEFSWLPTTIDVDFCYTYESHPSAMGKDGNGWDEDSHFLTLEIGLPDIPLEPVFTYERDIDRDDGTYLNLELGHTFAIIDAEEEDADAALDFRLSVAQGFGNSQRVKYYLYTKDDEPLNHSGLMDTCIKGEITWRPCEYCSISGYVAYYDFIFDSHIREAANIYEATGSDERNNFVAGLALNTSF
jgi:hypothetical protein